MKTIFRYITIITTFLFLSVNIDAQRKGGHWEDPVTYFKLKGMGTLKGSALYNHMWETKERYIVGMKCTVCNFTPEGDDPTPAQLPYTETTAYLYINEPGAIATESDWTKLPNGQYNGVYKIAATDIVFSFNDKTHQYSFDYTPSGSYNCNAVVSGMDFTEHATSTGKTDMGIFYSDAGGLRGYILNVIARSKGDWEEGPDGNPVDVMTEEAHYLQFTVDEVLLDGTDTPLTETERQSLIDYMEKLGDWLAGKDDSLGLGEHTDATESTVIEMIGIIGTVLLGNGIAAATGGGTGGLAGAMGSPTGGSGGGPSPSPTTPETPDMNATEPKRKEDEEENTGEAPPVPEEGPAQHDYIKEYMHQNDDGTMSMTDPITGKKLTYYPTADGKWESEMGTIYDKEGLQENIRFRVDNAETLSDVAKQAEKNVAEQHAKWESDAKAGYSQTAQEYKAWKEAQEAKLQKEEYLDRLASKYGISADNEKGLKDTIKYEQTMAQLDANMALNEADLFDKYTKAAETIDKGAEVIVNVMGETVPGGRVVKNVYTFTKATAVAATEAHVYNMDAADAAKHIGKGMTTGAIGVLQNQAGELTKNPLVEGVIVVGGESISAGLNAIANGEDVGDAMTKAAAKKAAFFLTGKAVQTGMKTTGYVPPETNSPAGTVEKFLGKGDMHANWSNLSSTNAVHVAEGIASAAQEFPSTYGGYDAVGDAAVNAKKSAAEFIKTVKNFSDAAAKSGKKS